MDQHKPIPVKIDKQQLEYAKNLQNLLKIKDEDQKFEIYHNFYPVDGNTNFKTPKNFENWEVLKWTIYKKDDNKFEICVSILEPEID